MAESSLSLEFDVASEEVGHFLGFGRAIASYTTDQNTDISRIVASGLRKFYFPVIDEKQPAYEWSFLRKTGTVTLATSDSDYDMADDFSGVVLDKSTSYASGITNRPLSKIPEHSIRQHQAMDPKTGVPKYFSIRNKDHAPTTGQRYEMLVYPTPGASENNKVISFRYVFNPNTIDTTNKYPAGGARYSEAILAAILAAAEAKQDDSGDGPHEQRFQKLLISSIRADIQAKSNDRGGEA